jgi:hypothetical protein
MIAKIIPVVRTPLGPQVASALTYDKWPRGIWAYPSFVDILGVRGSDAVGLLRRLHGGRLQRLPHFPNQGYEVAINGGTPQRMIFVLTRSF